MRNVTLKKIVMGALTLFVAVILVGCEEKGPAEKAGESVDKAGKDLKNAVDPRGPAEKVGDKVDSALGK